MRSRLAGLAALTDTDVDKIARHYGQTIRVFDITGSAEFLRSRILAIYYHMTRCRSTRIILTEDSWCWVRRA